MARMMVLQIILIYVAYFDVEISKLILIFVGRDNPEKQVIFGIIEGFQN